MWKAGGTVTREEVAVVFRDRFRQVYYKTGISVAEMAKKAQRRPKDIYCYLEGKRTPTALSACGLADALGVSIDWLFGRKEEENVS